MKTLLAGTTLCIACLLPLVVLGQQVGKPVPVSMPASDKAVRELSERILRVEEKLKEKKNDIWGAVGAISSAISAVIVFVTAFIAIKQIKEAAQARHVNVLSKVFADFHSDGMRRDRQFIYDNSFADYSKCSQEIRERVERVIELYQTTAFLATRSLIPSDLILEMYSGTYVAVWQQLETYVVAKRAETRLANYGAAFEELAKKAIEYRKNRFGEINEAVMLRYTAPLEVQPSEAKREKPSKG